MSTYIDVDTAVTVYVNSVPLTDDTDFKSTEEAVAYNAAGMDLEWHFTSTAGVVTVTAVTPTTAGTYDWTHVGNGMYKIEIPASGGASINNDTEGSGYFVGKVTGVLPFRGPTYTFRASALNDALIDNAWSTTRGLAGTALPNAAADAAGGLPISDAGGLDLDARLDAAITSRLAPTTAGRTLDVTATGAAGIDWGNVENPTTANDFTGTTIATTQKVDLNTIKTQSVTCTGAVEVNQYVGTILNPLVVSLDGTVGANVLSWNSSSVFSSVAGYPRVDVHYLLGSSQSQLSGLVSLGGYYSSNSRVPADMVRINGTSIAGTGTQVAAAFLAQYNVAAPVFTNESVNLTSTITGRIDAAISTRATPTNITAASGVVLASNGLDSISITRPSTVAANFREMFVQLYYRFFGKVTKSATEIKNFAANGTDVVTTQTISTSGDDETQGAAS